ncbi:MAG TPA: hypothetical protein VMZ71_13000 [Gemmataceae bacterium]|nr:hypothetical protein [Gemmataceae bacterium]
MAGTLEKIRPVGSPTSARYRTIVNLNKLIDDVELIRAAVTAMALKLDADGGVTDTNYAAGPTLAAIDTAAELLAAKIGNDAGTAYS